MKTVLLVSIIFQIVALVCAIRLMHFTKNLFPWIFIIFGIFLMIVRRAIPLFELFSMSENVIASNAEIIAMITSILFSLGCIFILPVIKGMRRNEDYLKITLNSVGDAIITTDINGKVVKLNPIAERLTGCKEINAIGELLPKVLNIVNVKNGDGAESPVDMLFENGTIVGLEDCSKLISKDGSKYYISISVAPIINKFGHAVGIVLVFKNVTSECKMRKKISESEKKLKTLFTAAKNVSFIITDVDVNAPKILEFSPGAEHIFGYKASEVIGTPVAILHQEESVKRFPEMLEYLRKSKKSFDADTFFVRKSGELFPALFTIFPVFDSAGELVSTIGVSIDISERKRAEENLKRSEAKFRANFEQGLVGMSMTSEKMEWIEVNDFLCKMLGYSRDELLKMTWVELTYFEDIEADISKYNKLLSGEINAYSLEKRFCHKNGSLVWAVISISVVRSNENNSIEYILCVVNNISEQKKATENLRLSEKKFRTICQNSPVLINSFNCEGKAVLWNDECEKTLGWSLDEINSVDDPFALFYPDLEIKNQVVSSLNSNHCGHFIEWHPYVKSGEQLVMMWANFKLSDSETISIGYNVTERSKVELELRDSREKYKKLINASAEGFCLVDVNSKMLDVNESLCRMIGYSKSEMVGKTPYNFADEKNVIVFSNQIAKSKNKKYRRYGASLIKKDGGILFVIVNATAVYNKSGEFSGSFAFLTDISDLKHVENDLRNSKEKAEESNRLKTAFLQNVSHEIRTPMNGILGFADLLREANLTGKEQSEYIDVIERSGNRMLNTINDLMDISRIESGQVELSLSDIALSDIIKDLCTFFKPEVQKKGLEFSFNSISSLEGIVINTDYKKLYEILANLIKNAIKYTKTGKIEFKCQKNKEIVEFYVKDTGIGIQKNKIESIFDRFVQADIGERKAYEGSGLGLAIAKSYVEMLGGRIWVESDIGVGSTFFVSIPIVKYNLNLEKNILNFSDNDYGIFLSKVLIVDDENTSFDYLNMILHSICGEILYAVAGYQAVEICKENPDIDLILMDIRLPILNGYEATREIREFNKDVVIIAQTAYANESDRLNSILAGCDDYLSKPIKREKLFAIIKKLIV